MLKKGICLLVLGVVTANQATANNQEAAKGFIRDNHLDLFFRNGYINRDYEHGRQDKAEWGQAATATFTSGFIQEMMGVGVDALGLYVVCLNGSESRSGAAGIDFFKQGGSGFATGDLSKGGAAVKFCISNIMFEYDDQTFSLSILSYDNSRLFPESYNGTLITSKEIKGLELNVGRFTTESHKSVKGRDNGGLKSTNVSGSRYVLTDHSNTSLYVSDVEDVPGKQYISLNCTISLQANQLLSFDFNGYRTKLGSDSADQDFNSNHDNKVWSLAASYIINAHTFMIAHQHNIGDTGYNYGWYQSAGGISDGSTTIQLTDSYWSDFNAEDERSWQVSHALDSAKYGVPDLTYRVTCVQSDNIKTVEASNGREREILNQVQYMVQSGSTGDLTLCLHDSFLRVSDNARSYNDDGNEIHAPIEHPSSVF